MPIPQIDRIAGRSAQRNKDNTAIPTGNPPSAIHCNQSQCAWFTTAPGSNAAKAGYAVGQQPSPKPIQGCAAIICNVVTTYCIRPCVSFSEWNRSDIVPNPTINIRTAVAIANPNRFVTIACSQKVQRCHSLTVFVPLPTMNHPRSGSAKRSL